MDTLETGFAEAFGAPPDLVSSAPGRVNLMGEHTDYNGGFVLPTALPLRTRVALGPSGDGRVEVVSDGRRDGFEPGRERRRGTWIDYVQGVTAALRHHGYAAGGFRALIRSDVPEGRGLASSAALEVALLRGLRILFAFPFGERDLARLARWGENEIVGAPVGILDPMACHLAEEESALFLDTRSLDHETLPLPPDTELVVVDSGVAHRHAGGGYRARRDECARAARALGVRELRDVGPPDLPRLARLDPPLDRRARHVVTENARVLEAVEALRRGDASGLGRLFDASHASMRDDFEVSVPEVDALVARTKLQPGVFGARLTGGGFGGAVVCLAERGRGRAIARAVQAGGFRVLLPAREAA